MPNGTFHKAKRPKWKCLFNEKTMLLDLFLPKINVKIMHTLSQPTSKHLQTNTLQLHIRGCDICGKNIAAQNMRNMGGLTRQDLTLSMMQT